MKLILPFIVATLIVPVVALPGRADMVPPRPYNNRTPPMLRVIIERLAAAIERGDVDAARALCDPRGWDTNLVGRGGSGLSSFVADGIRKRVYPRAEAGAWRRVGRVVIMTADLVGMDDKNVGDRIELVLVESKSFNNWLILAAGSNAARVQALAERVDRDWPLRPQKTR